MRHVLTTVLILLALPTFAETPDECAARLDREIAITSYEQVAEWVTQVEQECATSPEVTLTPRSSFVSIYPASGNFDFCVMSETLNVRNAPGGSIVASLTKGEIFTVDLGSKVKSAGYVWAEHDKGWSALYPLLANGDPDLPRASDLTNPKSCPSPTPTPVTTVTRATRTTQQNEVLQMGRTKRFGLSGADCAITVSKGDSIQSGKLYLAVGRFGWLRDEFMVDVFMPNSRSPLTFLETETKSETSGVYSYQFYSPKYPKDVLGRYTIEVKTYTESKKFDLQLRSKATYNIAVACE